MTSDDPFFSISMVTEHWTKENIALYDRESFRAPTHFIEINTRWI